MWHICVSDLVDANFPCPHIVEWQHDLADDLASSCFLVCVSLLKIGKQARFCNPRSGDWRTEVASELTMYSFRSSESGSVCEDLMRHSYLCFENAESAINFPPWFSYTLPAFDKSFPIQQLLNHESNQASCTLRWKLCHLDKTQRLQRHDNRRSIHCNTYSAWPHLSPVVGTALGHPLYTTLNLGMGVFDHNSSLVFTDLICWRSM